MAYSKFQLSARMKCKDVSLNEKIALFDYGKHSSQGVMHLPSHL